MNKKINAERLSVLMPDELMKRKIWSIKDGSIKFDTDTLLHNVYGHEFIVNYDECVNAGSIRKIIINGFLEVDLEPKNDIFEIKKVIYNDPATIVFWADGTKTVVKCTEDDEYDPEKGLAMCISKKALGNKGSYYDIFEKWLPDEQSKCQLDIEGFDEMMSDYSCEKKVDDLFLKYALEALGFRQEGSKKK